MILISTIKSLLLHLFIYKESQRGCSTFVNSFFYKLQTFFGRSWKQYGSRITTIQYVVESLKYFFLHFQKSLGCNHLTTFILIILDKSFQFTIIKNRNLNLYHNCFRKSWKRFFLTTRNISTRSVSDEVKQNLKKILTHKSRNCF